MIKSGTIVRAFSPAGTYWRSNFVCDSAAYVNEGDLIFSACHFDEDTLPDNTGWRGEFYEPTVEELCLLASLSLPIGYTDGILQIYPLRTSYRLPEKLSFSEKEAIAEISNQIRKDPRFNTRASWRNDIPPPVFGGCEYSYRHAPPPQEIQNRIFARIDSADSLLMRGIGAFIQGGMLSCHGSLFSAAHYALYISLDASFELVRREMVNSGFLNPSAVEVGDYFARAVGDSPTGQPYFSDYYEDRIRTFHTASRFGASPHLPLGHSDFFLLYYALREVYRFIILAERVDLADASD